MHKLDETIDFHKKMINLKNQKILKNEIVLENFDKKIKKLREENDEI